MTAGLSENRAAATNANPVSPRAGNIAQGCSLSCLRFITGSALKCYNSTMFLEKHLLGEWTLNTDERRKEPLTYFTYLGNVWKDLTNKYQDNWRGSYEKCREAGLGRVEHVVEEVRSTSKALEQGQGPVEKGRICICWASGVSILRYFGGNLPRKNSYF